MSQEEFAAQCGLHRTYIGALERGEKTMTIETANNVAQTLGLTLGQFFTALEQMQDGRGAPPCADTNEQNGASDGQSGKQANPSNIR
jgi:transcriptional regulator with XRE-family HTH domain